MTDYARKLLDELMPGRNLERQAEMHFWDENICKDFLVGFCPKDLFVNTKSDLGQCYKVHDEKFKMEFEEHSERQKYDYEEKFYRQLGTLIHDLDRRIQRQRERMNVRGDEIIEKQTQAQMDERREKIIMLEERIKAMQQRIEVCGEEGEIDEAKDLTNQVEQLSSQLNHMKAAAQKERRNDVCDICGATIVANEAKERKEAHLAGKQHIGYTLIRETYAKLRKKYESRGGGYHEDRGGSSGRGAGSGRYGSDRGPDRGYDRHNDRRGPPPSMSYDRSRDGHRDRDYRRPSRDDRPPYGHRERSPPRRRY